MISKDVNHELTRGFIKTRSEPLYESRSILLHDKFGAINMSELLESFSKHFNVTLVNKDDRDLMAKSLRLRYQVYCKENAFEKTEDTSVELESDEFDEHSAHSLLFSRRTGSVVGTVRLILSNPDQPDALFPIEQQCGRYFDNTKYDIGGLPRSSLAEISRFAISKEFKKRLMEDMHTWGAGLLTTEQAKNIAEMERRIIPHITLGLFAAIVQMSAKHGITHWYAVMEPALRRLLKRFSINFTTIGPMIDYHGKRQPCVAAVGEVLAEMEANCPDVWNLITDNGEIWPSAAKTAVSEQKIGDHLAPHIKKVA